MKVTYLFYPKLKYLILFFILFTIYGDLYSATIKFVGNNTDWRTPSSWDLNRVPTASDEVIIPMGRTALLRGNAVAGNIMVMGRLVVPGNSNFNLTAASIMIMGQGSLFQVGTETTPYLGRGLITLTGTNKTIDIHGMGAKFLGPMSGGTLRLHGEKRVSWTMLNRTVMSGSSVIVVQDPVDWRIGDVIVIASTELETTYNGKSNETQSEVRTITAISSDRRTITLNSPLTYNHFGELQTYSNSRRSWVVDERAEVGLLTRNLKVQGDAASEVDGFGGHVMSMQGSYSYISGVEFYRMGQSGIIGRYPFHWHMAGEVPGQFIKDCSINRSFSRAVTIHGTHRALVENNVCHDILGHAIFLEDGIEQNNIINRNLVVTVKKPAKEKALLPSDIFLQKNRIEGPSAFWISHPTNTVTNNAAVGTGCGFWYAPGEYPIGLSATTTVRPNRAPMGASDNNRAHACYVGWNLDFTDNATKTEVITAHYHQRTRYRINNFTGFKCYRGIWFRGNTIEFYDFKLANNVGLGQFVPTFDALFNEGITLGYSKNSFNGINYQTYATSIYDGNAEITGCHFENFDQPNQSIFTTFGGAGKNMPLVTERISTRKVNIYNPEGQDEFSTFLSFVRDKDGSLLGSPELWGGVGHPFIIDETNFVRIQPQFATYKSSIRFARVRLNFDPYKKQILFHEFADGHQAHSKPVGTNYDIPVAVGTKREYDIRLTEFIPPVFSLDFNEGQNGDRTLFSISGSPEELNVVAKRGSIVRVSDLNALRNASGNAYCWINQRMYFHLKAESTNGNQVTLELRTRSGSQLSVVYPSSRPYKGTLNKVNTFVQAENFDYGGQGVAYHEITRLNYLRHEEFRNRDHRDFRFGEIVDVTKSGTSNFYVSDIKAGEWLKYSFIIPASSNYQLVLRGASGVSTNRVEVQVDGKTAKTFSFPGTGSAVSFQNINLGELALPQGRHTITLKALTSDFNLDAFQLNLKNESPVVRITSPANNSSFNAPASIVINAAASDADGSISKVEYYNGSALIGTANVAPYVFTWKVASAGIYDITAKAFDNVGVTTTSIPVRVNVVTANKPPIVSITSPSNNAVFTSPSNITISASASDPDGSVARVDFYNGTDLLSTDLSAPYSFLWSNVKQGIYNLRVTAIDDKGASASSSIIQVVIGSNQLPNVSLISPLQNATYLAPASVVLNANASDLDGSISKVEFYNGSSLIYTDYVAPYSYTWNGIIAGNYVLTARAYDNLNAIRNSTAVNIVVNAVNTSPILGPECSGPNQTATFELSPAERNGATSYSWWCNGSTNQISQPFNQPYKATFTFSQWFTGGDVCVGINLSSPPYYKQICKPITICSSPSLQIESRVVVGPNPSYDHFTLFAIKDIQSFTVVNDYGNTVYSGGFLSEGRNIIFGENLINGIYTLKIIYNDGSIEVKRISKTL